MGFESSRMARRRLAALAETNPLVAEALLAEPHTQAGGSEIQLSLLAVDTADADDAESGDAPLSDSILMANEGAMADGRRYLDDEFDRLAIEIMTTPGAGSALLAAYAAQARALSLVVQAARLAPGGSLPVAVLRAAESALVAPPALARLNVA